jgi:ABC-type sugar transport system ATPase subunit
MDPLSAPQTTLAIEATGLEKSFGDTKAVDGVDLAVRRGSVYGVLGITGKVALWIALSSALADDPRLEGIDLEHLAQRAREQRQTVERLRRRAVGEALT